MLLLQCKEFRSIDIKIYQHIVFKIKTHVMIMRKNPRSLLKRAEAIFQVINQADKPFPKSRLKTIGLDPASAENWLDLIVYIQQETKIRLIKTDNNVIVDKITDTEKKT